MRLIDADALFDAMEEEIHFTAINASEQARVNNLFCDITDVINESPTIDAVPVEWIENYLRNYRYMAPIEKNFVREMIKAWAERKEE